jgi:hypothetical protein
MAAHSPLSTRTLARTSRSPTPSDHATHTESSRRRHPAEELQAPPPTVASLFPSRRAPRAATQLPPLFKSATLAELGRARRAWSGGRRSATRRWLSSTALSPSLPPASSQRRRRPPLSAPARPPLSPSTSRCRPPCRAPPPRPWAVSKAGPAIWIPVSGQRSIWIKIIVSDTYPRRIPGVSVSGAHRIRDMLGQGRIRAG